MMIPAVLGKEHRSIMEHHISIAACMPDGPASCLLSASLLFDIWEVALGMSAAETDLNAWADPPPSNPVQGVLHLCSAA